MLPLAWCNMRCPFWPQAKSCRSRLKSQACCSRLGCATEPAWAPCPQVAMAGVPTPPCQLGCPLTHLAVGEGICGAPHSARLRGTPGPSHPEKLKLPETTSLLTSAWPTSVVPTW